jgi:phosphopantothenoylcysteine decarboxylase/phosphopantothenate--cysteine ligase
MTHPLANKRILLGVTGSIAAYKAADLASKLTQTGALVDVVLTESAQKFVSPLTFQSVTGRKAYIDADLWGGEGHVTHIGLGHAAELMLVAPVSANTLAKLAHGSGDNLLSVTVLASHCPLVLAPAMDAGMYEHPATQENVRILKDRGAIFIGPDEGHLASGLVGLGRFVDPARILEQVRFILSRNGPLDGRKVVVTAGGTQEAIDPVRLITNRSSGKQGYAVAQAVLDAGAEVTLVTAPTGLTLPFGAKIVTVKTAQQMMDAVLAEIAGADVLIMAAAVADFRPVPTAQKIKKDSGIPTIKLETTADILAAVAEQKTKSGFPKRTIGFAAESQDLVKNAQAKLQRKHLDMIVANDISAADAGFEVDTNRVLLLFPDGSKQALPVQEKTQIAEAIIQQVISWG